MNPRVFLLALGTFALGTEGFVIAGVLPAISRDLSVSVVLAGQLVTFFALTYALASPVLSTLTSRWERRRLLVASLIIFTADALRQRSTSGPAAATAEPVALLPPR